MSDNTKQKLEALQKLINLMSEDKDLPRDLQIEFDEIKNYIKRNQ